jgi:hypothetical protein
MGAVGCLPCGRAAGGMKLTTHPHVGVEVKNDGFIIKVIKPRIPLFLPLHAVILARNSTVSEAKLQYFLSVLSLF